MGFCYNIRHLSLTIIYSKLWVDGCMHGYARYTHGTIYLDVSTLHWHFKLFFAYCYCCFFAISCVWILFAIILFQIFFGVFQSLVRCLKQRSLTINLSKITIVYIIIGIKIIRLIVIFPNVIIVFWAQRELFSSIHYKTQGDYCDHACKYGVKNE